MYGTHSPFFVDLQRFDQIRLARKILTDNTSTLQTSITSYSRAQAAQRLAEISLRPPEDFTDVTFIARAAPVMTTIVNEGFFADLTVVVEGLSDAAALWTIQEIQSRNWDALGITIVPVGGKNNIDRPVVVFRGLDIPTYFLFDADSRYRGTEKERPSASGNRLLLRLAGVPAEDFPSTNAFDTWAVLNDELEFELKLALGDAEFLRVRQIVADQLAYSQPSTVLKNSEGVSYFIREVYSNERRIPILEEIVTRITALRDVR
jgi:predicted ATP-dependent endonuclease of OLD family